MEDNELSPEEQAFERADQFEFAGKTLAGLSFLHMSTAEILGCRYWRVEPDAVHPYEVVDIGSGKSITVEVYEGQGHDAAIILWLLSQPEDRVKAARRNPRAFESEIDAFGEEHKIIGAKGHWNAEALALVRTILEDERATRGALPNSADSEKKTVL